MQLPVLHRLTNDTLAYEQAQARTEAHQQELEHQAFLKHQIQRKQQHARIHNAQAAQVHIIGPESSLPWPEYKLASPRTLQQWLTDVCIAAAGECHTALGLGRG